MSAIDNEHKVSEPSAAPEAESKVFLYLIGLTVLGIVGVALYQFLGCATCY